MEAPLHGNRLTETVEEFERDLLRESELLPNEPIILSPYYWLTIPPFQTSEVTDVFLKRYYQCGRAGSVGRLIKLFIRNIKNLVATLSFKKVLPPIFWGSVNPEASVYIQTW